MQWGKEVARKQQEKSRQTREELMDAAVILFGEQGFAATSIAEITARAGYAKGSFYRHWDSKDAIFLQIVEAKLATYRQMRQHGTERAVGLEAVMNVIWDFLETIIDDRNWSKIFLEFTIHAARNDELRKELNRGKYRLSNEIFADLVKGHVETDYPPAKIGALNTALFEGFLIHSSLGTGVLEKKDVRRAAIRMALMNGTKAGA